jgi:hypothetical protein
MFPTADALYACDEKWWNGYRHLWEPFEGMKITRIGRLAEELGITAVATDGVQGVSDAGISTGRNSGYQAIGCAHLLGAARIVLVGFDMMAKDRQSHWHADHRGHGMTNPTARLFKMWIPYFDTIYEGLRERGVELVNASRETAIKSIPRVSLDELCDEG